ncbi:MAG TPA: glycine--tRNA ligase [Thermoplasmata archaeon]|nr:glycine--tRNA ligase [Thermoplasmata archaeon]
MKLDELYALLRRRGVLWPTAEIYGGAQGLFDYGPLGAALKRNVEDAWTAWFVGLAHGYYRIDPAEILPEAVVRASGHLENFTDPEVSCEQCHQSFRAETVLEKVRPEGVDGLRPEQIGEIIRARQLRCPNCGSLALTVPRPFNLMFGLDWGPTGRERAYLRPETAQSSYLGFARMWDVGRRHLPLGIAVVGKAYRNEIAPRQLLFRMRAFTQAELQIFFDPKGFPVPFSRVADEPIPVLRVARREAGEERPEPIPARALVADGDLPEFYVYHLAQTYRFLRDVLGYPAERIRFLEKSDAERAFYNRIQFDAEVRLDSLGGFREVGAVHYRGDYDLGRHGQGSGKDLAVTPTGADKVLPHVLELTFGVDRNVWALADLHLGRDGDRTVWRLPTWLAPTAVGVFPLIPKEHGAFAERLADELANAGHVVQYDDAGAIGKRYYRSDEAGTPFCVTVDGGTVGDGPERGTVTLRSRDSKEQLRLPAAEVEARLRGARAVPRPPRGGGAGVE